MNPAAASPPCVCTTLRKASRAVTRLYDEALADCGLTTTQFAILRNLDRHGPLPLSRLADLLVMERTSLYRTLAPIEARRFIQLGASGRGRARTAALTDQGRAVMTSGTAAWEEAQRRIVGALGSEVWGGLEKQLRQLVEIAR